MRQTRNLRRKRGLPPFLMWRLIVSLWLLSADLLMGPILPERWPHIAKLLLSMILLGGYFLLLLEMRRYTMRFIRQTPLTMRRA